MPVAVVTDSTHYLPADVLARHELRVVSLYVKRGETLERESEISDLDALYDRLRAAGDGPATGLRFFPPPGRRRGSPGPGAAGAGRAAGARPRGSRRGAGLSRRRRRSR